MVLPCRSQVPTKGSTAVPDHSPLDSDLQSNNSEDQSQAASVEQPSELDMQEVQQVLDSADERTLQAEQRALKAEEAAQVCCHVHVQFMAPVALVGSAWLIVTGELIICSQLLWCFGATCDPSVSQGACCFC